MGVPLARKYSTVLPLVERRAPVYFDPGIPGVVGGAIVVGKCPGKPVTTAPVVALVVPKSEQGP